MPTNMKHRLPFIAVAALVAAVACLVLIGWQKNQVRRATDTNLPAVEAALAEMQASPPAALGDGALRQALERLRHTAPIAYVWGVGADGIVFYSSARFTPGERIERHATEETRRILAELPDGQLSASQKLALLTASAIQSEGEHNDVYRQLVRPIRAASGAELGVVGVAYSAVSDDHGLPGPAYLIPLLLVPLGLATYWLALVWWVFLDARSRNEPAWVWAGFVLLGNFVAVFAYLLVRPRPRQIAG